MYLVDTNVLVYSVNEAAREYLRAREWLSSALAGPRTVGFSWAAIVGFIRVTTHPRVISSPLTPSQAAGIAQAWIEQPSATVVEPQRDHLKVMSDLLTRAGAGGNLAVDAHLAALALEHDAEVVTFDRDFGRFPGVRWRAP